MHREDLDKRLDEWLDRATREYGRAERRPGFEARIIENLNGRLEQRRWCLRWAPAAVTVTAILAISVFMVRNSFQDRATTDMPSKEVVEVSPGSLPSLRTESGGSAAILAVPVAKMPTGAVHTHQPGGRFLSSGLSDQERYLIAFARAASEQIIAGLAENNEFEPPQMPDLEIPAFLIPEFEMTSFGIEDLHEPTPENEEKS
jgi:hypothetical protein